MKNLLYLFAIVLLFSCSPKKVITATKIDQKTTEQKDVSDIKSSQKEENKKVGEQLDTNTEIDCTETEYDTSKPNDPITGKPPIKSEKKTTTKKGENKKTNTAVNTKEKEDLSHTDKGKVNNDIKSDTIVKEIPKTPWIAYACWLVGIIAVLAGLFFTRKYWTVIKTFLGLNNK